MGNAVKFTERGHVQLRVNDEQCRLHLTIQDTGLALRRTSSNVFLTRLHRLMRPPRAALVVRAWAPPSRASWCS